MRYLRKSFGRSFTKRVSKKRKYAEFPFLRNKETVSYIRRTKVVFIMRGLPGSGKSYIAKQIMHRYGKSCIVCSADYFFVNEKLEYVYDAAKLREAHSYSQNTCQKAMLMDKKHVVVDNTNVQQFEMCVYLNHAKSHNYIAILVEPKTSWKFDVDVLAEKNKHGCKVDYIETRKNQYDEMFPIYWAFFLNEFHSNCIRGLAKNHFYECLSLFREFNEDLSRQHSDSVGTSIYETFYNIGVSRILHCTTYFRRPDGSSYSTWDDVEKSVGKYFQMDVSGFMFTPRVAAAVVKLKRSQLKLWNSEDIFMYEEDCEGNFIPTKFEGRTDRIGNDFQNCDALRKTAASELERVLQDADAELCLTFANKQNIDEERTSENSPVVMKRGSRAHLTIGCHGGVENVQSGYDVLSLKHLYDLGHFQEVVYENKSTYVYYGDGQCEVKFDWPLKVGSLFAGSYGI